jgi:hypothetical protein
VPPDRPSPQRGWLLIGLIVLASAVILTLVGLTVFLSEHLRAIGVHQNQTKAIALAQAGVMQAMYDFRQNNGLALRAYNVDNPAGPLPGATDDQFTLQAIGAGHAQADFLLMNMRGNVPLLFPQTPNFCGAPRDRLQDWPIRNVLAAGGSSIVINSFRVDWDAGVEGVLGLALNGATADWTAPGCVAVARNTEISLVGVPVANRTLAAGARWADNRIWFSSTAMDGKVWFDVIFTLSDGSVRIGRWDRVTVANRTADLTLKAVGDVREGLFPFGVWRRLQTTYRICAEVSGGICNGEAEERQQRGAIRAYSELTVLTP